MNAGTGATRPSLWPYNHERFFVGCQSGPSEIAELFHVRSAITNLITWSDTPIRKGDLFTVKLLQNTDGSLLSLKEYFDRGLHLIQAGSGLPDDLQALENTPRDILELVKEMYASVSGESRQPQIDTETQQITWRSSFPENHCPFTSESRLGSHFVATYGDHIFETQHVADSDQ